jgi:hypothetical protein
MTMIAAALEHPYPIDEPSRQRWEVDGYLHLSAVLAAETLAPYGERIAHLVSLRDGHQPMESRTMYGKAFLQVMNLWTEDALVRELVFSPRLAGIAATLMGVSGVRLYHDQALFKEPGGGATPWHTDQQVWPLEGRCCTAWIPLVDGPLDTGPISFARGSHRHDYGRFAGVSGRPSPAVLAELGEHSERQLVRSLRDVPEDARALSIGDISFHDGWTFHRAGPNLSSRMRAVMTIIYMEEGIRVIAPRTKNQQVDLEIWLPGVTPGTPAASPLNPLLYGSGSGR